MSKAIEDAERELADLRTVLAHARKAADVAADAARAQEHRVHAMRVDVTRENIATMDVESLREYVADLARSHGARCATLGSVDSVEWGPFRAALGELARRNGAEYRKALEFVANGNISPAMGLAKRVLSGEAASDALTAEIAESKKRWEAP